LPESLLTVAETAELLKVSKGTVYRYVEINALPHIRKKFGLRFRRTDLDAWLDRDKQDRPPLPRLFSPPALALLRKTIVVDGGLIQEMSRAGKTHYYYLGRSGTIYKRRSKKWGVRYYLNYIDGQGERTQKIVRQARSHEEAVQELMKAMAEAEANRQGFKKPERINFRDFSDRYLEKYALTNKRSWKTDRSYIKSMLPVLGDRFLDEITSEEIEEFKTFRLARDKVEKSTVNRCLAIMRKLFNLAADWGYIQRDQIPRFKLFPEGNILKERILSEAEEGRLLGAAALHLRSILVVALNTGCRLGEILNLQWDQVDLKARTIRVERTKNDKIRIIPVNSALDEELARLSSSRNGSGYVFFNPETQKPYTSIKTAFKAACRRALISGLRLHDMRHTFATRLIASGVDLITVKDLLGHGSVRITEKYAHSNQDQKRKAVAVLSDRAAENSEIPASLCKKRDKSDPPVSPSPVSPLLSIN